MARVSPDYLSKTYFDVASAIRPELMAEIIAHATSAVGPDRGWTMAEIVKEPQQRAMLKAIGSYAAENLSRMGYDIAGVPVEQLIEHMPGGIAEVMFEAIGQEYVHNFNFVRHGKKVFHFRRNLVERLLDTDLNVDVEQVALPFPTAMFVFSDQPARDALYAMGAREGHVAPSDGVISAYVSTYETADGKPGVYVAAYHCVGKEVKMLARREMLMTPGTVVEDALRTRWDRLPDDVMPRHPDAVVDDDLFMEEGRRFIRLAINCALYLSSADPETAAAVRPERPKMFKSLPAGQRRRIAREEENWTSVSYIDVGRSFTPYESSPHPGQGRELGYRQKVRGHWKSQVHGAGRAGRRVILVQPYWRGPDAAEVVNRAYVVR